MLSINTNISSLITQRSMKSATNLLNQAVERMSTGYKVNHAKDNAAAYSIITNMDTKIGAYQVAEDNCAMGMDMVATASDTVSMMQDKAERLRALCIQARNGTYGAQSMSAINSEAAALMAEINRLYSTSEYNSIKIFSESDIVMPTGRFLVDPVTYKSKSYIDKLTSVSEANGAFTESEYKIEDVNDLVELANLTNAGVSTAGVTFILANDIDIGAYCDEEIAKGNGGWTPIGIYISNTDFSKSFAGIFDGNGHVISNLKVDRAVSFQGLFGSAVSGSEIKNIGIEGGSISGEDTLGCLVGYAQSAISNCYATGNIEGDASVGGLVGASVGGTISNCYATANVEGEIALGGLVAEVESSSISNCYATGSVKGDGNYVGGLVGYNFSGIISNCYATGNIEGEDTVGGLVGASSVGTISNCYATGNVSGEEAGGLLGGCAGEVINSFATGTVSELPGYNGGFASLDSYNRGLRVTNCQSVQDNPFTFQGEPVAVMTVEQIKSPSNLESLGFTEANGWSFENGNPVHKAYIAPVPVDSNCMISLQVGVNSDSSCQIDFDVSFMYNLAAIRIDISSDEALNAIDNFVNIISEKSTRLGAVQNRLNSALDEISTQYENLVSSRSTLRDADIAEISSQYIQQQILQQASATLMATANQAPSIALQLI